MSEDYEDHTGPSGAIVWPMLMLAVYALAGLATWACLATAPESVEGQASLLELPTSPCDDVSRWLPGE